MRLPSVTAAAVLLSASFAAHADTFDFSFGNSSSPFSGSGVLTTGTLLSPGQYLIARVTGKVEVVPNGPNIDIKSMLAPGDFRHLRTVVFTLRMTMFSW